MPYGKTELMRTGDRRLAIVLVSICLILLVILSQSVLALHRDVEHLSDVMATKDELANLAVSLSPGDPTMTVLEGTCTSCHTREAFTKAHGITTDVHDLVVRMSEIAGEHIPAADIPKAEAALTFMKCAHCHSIDRLKKLAVLSPTDRWGVIVSMMKEPGATISQEDAQRIRDSYGDFWGWHRKM